jgi:MoxR-like ATPase
MTEDIKSISILLDKAESILKNQRDNLRFALCTIICEGHLLIEDMPGVGKTTMVQLLATLIELPLSRIQFTNDMLPGDILGTQIFDKAANDFLFKKGPLFGNLILADELNRATPKTQSALLQAMEEKEISIDNVHFELPRPFVVMATQNPTQQIGTFPLPESQLDRFFISLTLDLPTRDIEKEILRGKNVKKEIDQLSPMINQKQLLSLIEKVDTIHMDDQVYEFVLDILSALRGSKSNLHHNISIRAGLDLVKAAKANALIEGRDFVTPDDVKDICLSVMSHRVGGQHGVHKGQEEVLQILQQVKVK